VSENIPDKRKLGDRILENYRRLHAQLDQARKAGDREAAWSARYAIQLLRAAAEARDHLGRLSDEQFGPRRALEDALRGEDGP
jgi:hypothetical protein